MLLKVLHLVGLPDITDGHLICNAVPLNEFLYCFYPVLCLCRFHINFGLLTGVMYVGFSMSGQTYLLVQLYNLSGTDIQTVNNF